MGTVVAEEGKGGGGWEYGKGFKCVDGGVALLLYDACKDMMDGN